MTSELVLVVDDELPIVQLARMYLEQENFRVGQALDGVAALESVKTLNPALIILDIMLPKLDGFEVCRQLRADHNPVAIILLTARDEDIDKILGLELGADDYLTKPFNPRELVARVKAILRRTERTIPPGTSIKFSDLEINTLRREVRVEDRILFLPASLEGYSPEHNYFRKPGGSIFMVKPARWMYTSPTCEENYPEVQ
jgi:two-component system alkaline phosphatase synthesis response regulator PhoP